MPQAAPILEGFVFAPVFLLTFKSVLSVTADMQPLWRLSASTAVELLRSKRITPLQLVEASEARWKETDPLINAMPITCWERAKERAKQLEQHPENPPQGYLYGLPVAVKDLTAVKGLPFTRGSKLYKDCIADYDDPLVQVLEQKGAIIVGKTNTPEWGAGSQTYNEVFGTTYNPWDTSRTSGGSSGGSAAAVAVGQVWLATGTDFGGSLRNPASYCGIVGMRNSIGLVPQDEGPSGPAIAARTTPDWRVRSVSGLLARTVADLALGLDAIAGQHDQDPVSLPAPERHFSSAVVPGAAALPKRVAFSPDLGVSPVCQEVIELCRNAAQWWSSQGAEVVQDCPDLSNAPEVFHRLRAYQYKGVAEVVLNDPGKRDVVKPELIWQGQAALDLTQEQVQWAEHAHDELLDAVQQFFQQYDLLACPTVMLPPFDASITWPRDFNGHKLPTYIDWLRTTSAISVLQTPAISIPCGFTKSGLPVGLQLVGPPGADVAVLAAAAAFEQAHQYAGHLPIDVVVGKTS